MKAALRREVRDLVLVAGGAIPGALLRWRLEGLVAHATGATLAANLLGCWLLGMVLARPGRGNRLMLVAGIGFCGSLSTFSTLMLQLSQALAGGDVGGAVGLLLASLVGGVAMVALGHRLGAALPGGGERG